MLSNMFSPTLFFNPTWFVQPVSTKIWGPNSHFFHVGDSHYPDIRGLHAHYQNSNWSWDDDGSLDLGTYGCTDAYPWGHRRMVFGQTNTKSKLAWMLKRNTIRKKTNIYIYMYTVYGCFQKWWYPQIIHFNRVFHYKPSILGYHYFWKHPYIVKLDHFPRYGRDEHLKNWNHRLANANVSLKKMGTQ